MAITVGDEGGRLLWRAPFSTEEVNIRAKAPMSGQRGLRDGRIRKTETSVSVEGSALLTGSENG